MVRKFNAVGVGRAYVDIIAEVSSDFLQRNNMTSTSGRKIDILELRKIQSLLHSPKLFAGGCSANTMAMISSLGGTAGFFGNIKDDEAGQIFLKDFQSREVVLCSELYKGSIGTAICLVLTTHDRFIAYTLGCADYFQTADFIKFDFSTTDFFLVEAFLLTSQQCGAQIELALNEAKFDNARIAFNLQSYATWQEHQKTIDTILTFADVILGNKEEINIFRERLKMPLPANIIMVSTEGANGVTVFQGNNVIHVDAESISDIVNTLGAGDALTSGFLLGLSYQFTINESLRLGVLAAKEILAETGARPTRSLKHLVNLIK